MITFTTLLSIYCAAVLAAASGEVAPQAKTIRYHDFITIEVFVEDDEWWAPAAVPLALGYRLLRFDSDSAVYVREGRAVEVPLRDDPSKRRPIIRDPNVIWPRWVPIHALAVDGSHGRFGLLELRFASDFHRMRYSPRAARSLVAKYGSVRTVPMPADPPRRSWYRLQPSQFDVDRLRIVPVHATFGYDAYLVDPQRIKDRGWSPHDPEDLSGMFSLEVLLAAERTDRRLGALYTHPLSWVAHFEVPGRPRSLSTLMRGHNYGTAQPGWGYRLGVELLGWNPYDDPDEPKLTRGAFWAPAAARPVALEYFDGYRHVRLRLRDARDQRTDPAPISETEFRRPIPGAMPGGAGAGPARRPCR
jgi:hypothetical protein